MRPLRIVVDAGNGMAGYTVPAVLAGLPVEVVPLYFELDGTFPNHEANPIEPKNLVELQRAVNEVGADLGLAFDGDADRCFVVDEHGQPVSPSAIIGLVATRELSKHPGSRVVHNVITSLAATEVITEHGGVPIRSRVGHSFIKQVMAETGAIFGGEHSGHYYFRDFWRADTGMLAALHVLAAAAERNTPFSQLAAEFARYVASGELNSVVTDVPAMLDRVDAHFAGREGVDSDRLDGLTIRLPGKR
jgi:phosphomannomutase